MRDRMQELWDGAVPMGVPCPQADPAAVKRRVNAALNAVPSERRAYMRHKIRFAAAAAAIAALLAGSALAVASRWNVLDFYFEGDNTLVEDYVSHETYSIRDDNYTLSVISSVADTSSAYLLVTIEAKNDAAAAALMADDFENMDTFSVRALENEAVKPEPTPTGNGPAVEMPVAGGFSYGEKEALRTETSRTYSMRVDELNAAVYAVQLRLGLMEEGSYVEIPVELVEPVTVEVNAEGTGSGTFDHIEGGAPVTLETVSLSPFSIQMEYSFADADGDAFPLLFFRMTDGSLCGWGGSGRAHILEVDAIHKALCYLILQFQHDALGQLGAYAGCRLEGLVVACRDRQRHPVRLHDAENGQAHLGAHTGNGGQQLKAALLLLGGKAIQADVIFGHAHHGVKGGFPAHPGQCTRNAGRALHIVAHPAAAHHHSVQGLFDDFS